MRPSARFGVILYAEDGFVGGAQTAIGAVEEADMGLDYAVGQAVGIELEGNAFPHVVSVEGEADLELRRGDIVVKCNGKAAKGAVKTARHLIRESMVELTIWRPCR